MADVDEHRIEVDGIPMRWLEAGTGVPAVLVHGFPTSPELWRRVLARLQGVRGLAWELVGYGDSIPAGRGRDIAIARQADYLTAWLRALGIGPAILVGHDLGGGVAQIAAVRRPELCAGLVLTNAIGYDAWPVWPVRAVRRLHGLAGRVPDGVAGRLFGLVLRWMHNPPAVGRESARIHWRHYARHDGASALVRQARSLDPGDTLAVADRLAGLDVPARVLWGDADRFLPVSVGDRLARDLGTTLRPIPGCRHFTPEDRPDAVAAAIGELAAGL